MCPKYSACYTFRDPRRAENKSGNSTKLTDWARYLHPLLPDPPPFLLKHVTKTSIAVPALPVIKLGTSDPAILPTLQGQVDCLLRGTQPRVIPCFDLGPQESMKSMQIYENPIKSMKSIGNQAWDFRSCNLTNLARTSGLFVNHRVIESSSRLTPIDFQWRSAAEVAACK